jgi:hypothetical protein
LPNALAGTVRAAGIFAAGIRSAGIRTAGIHTAGIRVAGIRAAGNRTAGICAASIRKAGIGIRYPAGGKRRPGGDDRAKIITNKMTNQAPALRISNFI